MSDEMIHVHYFRDILLAPLTLSAYHRIGTGRHDMIQSADSNF